MIWRSSRMYWHSPSVSQAYIQNQKTSALFLACFLKHDAWDCTRIVGRIFGPSWLGEFFTLLFIDSGSCCLSLNLKQKHFNDKIRERAHHKRTTASRRCTESRRSWIMFRTSLFHNGVFSRDCLWTPLVFAPFSSWETCASTRNCSAKLMTTKCALFGANLQSTHQKHLETAVRHCLRLRTRWRVQNCFKVSFLKSRHPCSTSHDSTVNFYFSSRIKRTCTNKTCETEPERVHYHTPTLHQKTHIVRKNKLRCFGGAVYWTIIRDSTRLAKSSIP